MDALREGPLHIAARAGDGREVARLIAAGAVVDAGNYRGYTPLHIAAGCPVDAVDSSGRTALWYAAATGTVPWTAGQQAVRLQVLQHLLHRGADPNIAAHGQQGRPLDAARGLHQPKQYRIEWAQGAALLETTANE